METKKLITDFTHKYRNYIIYAIVTWFVITATISYMILSSSEDINMMMCFGYLKAKIRSLFFFLPDNWLCGISVKAGVGHFRRIIAVWGSIFAEYSWKLYLYILGAFVTSFLVCASAVYLYFKKQIKNFKDNIIVTGKIVPLEEFQHKYPEAFGSHINFAGLNLSEKIFKTPFYVWGNDESINKILWQFLEDSRSDKSLYFPIIFIISVFTFCIDDQEAIILYLNKLQEFSDHKISKDQKLWIQNFYLNNKNRDPLQEERHKIRKEFNSKKHKLKQEWEAYYKLKWPQVKITKKNAVTTIDFEAHHSVPINAGGINSFWNISPLTSKNHHLLHESLEEKACFSHDFVHRKFMRFILKMQTIFLNYFESYINKKGINYAH